jgi:hypothetical protein
MKNRQVVRAAFVVTVATGLGCSDSSLIVNPPFDAQVCPSVRPDNGTSCSLSSSRVCGYAPLFGPCPPTFADTANCVDGRWVVSMSFCNPPDVQPPRDVVFVCPSSPADLATTCAPALEGSTCGWGNCGGSPTTMARCSGGTWNIATVSCNPPPDVPTTD